MHLPRPFYRLPLRYDVERLRAEVAALPASAWAPHPNGIAGNTSVRLISADGGENDSVEGHMRPTPHLMRSPYIRQILARLGVAWSRSRLLRLAPGVGVGQHSDINYHWYYRIRMHIPVITRPEVRFHCDGQSVHMAAGEAWVFDNWRQHHVVNDTPDERIHLVADTAGNSGFWQLVASSDDMGRNAKFVPYETDAHAELVTERATLRPVMNPAEIEMLVGNLRGDLVPAAATNDVRVRLMRYHAILDSFVRDWRNLYFAHGEDPVGWPAFARLRDATRAHSLEFGDGVVMGVNRVAAHKVLEARVLRVCLATEGSALSLVGAGAASVVPVSSARTARSVGNLARPIIIVAAPRSGSTLLFETAAASEQLATLGGEAHWLIESIAELRPGAPGVSSNRLLAANASPPIIDRIRSQVLDRLIDSGGAPLADGKNVRFLEKTPKNALRIPFLEKVFPDAFYVFLWREPRGNLSSIIEAWRSGNWRTYPHLEGFPFPWSLLLPPGWEQLRGRPLEEVAAFQWKTTNETVLSDLEGLPSTRWTCVEYARFIADPARELARVFESAGLAFDAGVAARTGAALPAARHTLTPASAEKWRKNEAEIAAVLPGLTATWDRLCLLQDGAEASNR